MKKPIDENVVSKEGWPKRSPKEVAAKAREKIAVTLGHRPLRVVCDVCGKILLVPMATLSRASCLALLRSIDFKVGGKETVEALREIIDQTIEDGRLKDFAKAKAIPKRCASHGVCAGWDGHACAATAPPYVYSRAVMLYRNGAPWRCRRCGYQMGQSSRTSAQRAEAARSAYAEKTPKQRAERARKISMAWNEKGADQRSEIARKRAANKTPKQRIDAYRKGRAAMTQAARSEAARKRQAAKTPEQRSEISRKIWATRRAKKEPKP